MTYSPEDFQTLYEAIPDIVALVIVPIGLALMVRIIVRVAKNYLSTVFDTDDRDTIEAVSYTRLVGK